MRKDVNQPPHPGIGVTNHSPGKEFAFQVTLDAIARIVADTETEAREKLAAMRYLEPKVDGGLIEGAVVQDSANAKLLDVNSSPRCRECRQPYEEGGDGWNGLCPECADRASIILDAEEEGWMFVETPDGWYAERDERRTQLFRNQVDAANFVDDARDLLELPDPGKPDVVYLSQKRAIFVHSCFWHGHHCARGARIPRENREYWVAKIERNRMRDAAHARALRAKGWRRLTIWECELKEPLAVRKRLQIFLGTR
jgi:DNA mismatch endonuclease Vsr